MNKNVFRVGFVIAAVAALALLAPVIWAAASAGIGIIVLGIICAVGIGALQFLPYLGQKLENTVLKMRKAEARANPIEQLQNYFIEKKKRVEEFRQAVIAVNTQIAGLEEMVRQRKRTKPNYDSSDEDKSIAQMRQVYKAMELKHLNATTALGQLEETIEEKKFKWNFGQAGQRALATLNASSGEDLIGQMLADEASSAVLDNFNRVFAELELEAQHLTDAKQLEFQGGMTIDVSAINLTQREKVLA